jgi:hypothetical protein
MEATMKKVSTYRLGDVEVPNEVKGDKPTRSPEITAASVLYYFTGIAFFVGTVPIALYIIQNRELPSMMGVKVMGGGFIETLGFNAVVAATLLFEVVNAGEVIAGYWLWKSRKNGGKLGVALFPLGMVFWIGFALPIPLVVSLARMVLLMVGWKKLH